MTPDERMTDRVALPVIGLVSSLVVIAVGLLLVGCQQPMGAVSVLPLVNAWLNGTSALLLTAGYGFIRQRKVTAHKTCMVTAFGVSSCFLVSNVIYHYHAGSKPFGGHGWVRGIYYPLLLSHLVLAVLIVPPLRHHPERAGVLALLAEVDHVSELAADFA